MAEVFAIDGVEWKYSPTPRVSRMQVQPPVRRCGSLQEQYAAFCDAQGALEREEAMLIRLPKQKDEISPAGFIALKTLTEKSAGKGMRPQCHAECAAMLDSHQDLEMTMRWLDQMPGNWGNEMVLQALHDPRSGQSVLGIRVKNIILFRSSLHALEAKLGKCLIRLIEEGARMPQTQAVLEVCRAHEVKHVEYQSVIQGPWAR